MASDRARLTYYPPRKYREVVSQQGRVLLEADSNEAQRIGTEEVRHHALDFVGPCGTPDNGYEVSPLPGFDFQIGPGTMYVGGLRTTLEKAIKYSAQPDWLDTALPQPWSDGLWKRPQDLKGVGGHVLLLLREQEITAVEDPAQREVSLGGPDTAARTRMLQRIVLADTKGTTCAAAEKDVPVFWSQHGLLFDAATAQLNPRSRLQVTLATDPPSPSPCDPPAASGYLGADNQLIRIQITAFDPVKNAGRLLWGYNNASTLYRCQALDPVTVELATRPVSAEFQPRAGQVAQLLLPAADLDEGAYAAALTGFTAKLTAPYNPDTHRITLPAAMPAVVQIPAPPPPLYLRLWEDEIPFTPGAPATLTGTGLQVTVTAVNPGMLHIGDHWSIAARPLTPNAVYPERYLAHPQPPDGPRMWACSLAVLRPSSASFTVDDCRVPFDNLTELTARKEGACCCVTVPVRQAGTLQKILDQAAATGAAEVSVHLEPGLYALKHPLLLTSRHNGLTLASCTGGTVIFTAADPKDPAFAYGMVQAAGVSNLRLEGIEFQLAQTPLPPELLNPLAQSLKSGLSKLNWAPAEASIGVHALSCRSLALESCIFRFAMGSPVFGAGLLVQGANGTIEVERCQFLGENKATDSVYMGVVLASVLAGGGKGQILPSLVEALDIENCLFASISVGVFAAGRPLSAALRGNVARTVHSAVLMFPYDHAGNPEQAFVDLWNASATSQGAKLAVAEFLNDRFSLASIGAALAWPLGDKTELKTVVELTALAVNPGALPIPAITLDANQFDARSPFGQNAASGAAVVLWNLSGRGCVANLTGNTMWNGSLLPTLAVIAEEAFNITGNLLGNQFSRGQLVFANRAAAGGLTLIVQPAARTAEAGVDMFTVSGNTIFGRTNLAEFPRREWQSRLPPEFKDLLTWEFFNSIG